MRKIRLLALLLAILMVSSAFVFASCDNTEEDICADGEHEWKNEQNPQKRKEIQALSCTTPEIRERECKKCGHKENYESAPPTGHKYNSSLKIDLQDATCTEDGHTLVRCMHYKICGNEKLEVLPGSALGHEYVNYVQTADGYSAIAKCIRCDSTSEKLLGLRLDMEGDRSHLSYQRMEAYVGSVQNAAEYKTVTDGDKSNTYLSITRPEVYNGDDKLGVRLTPEGSSVYGKTYIFEALYLFDEEETGDIVMFEGVKASMNQSMIFLTYNSEDKTIYTRDGAVYTLGDDDFANGVKVSLKLNDSDKFYEVFINDKLASWSPITYINDYYPGIFLAGINIYMDDTGASTFGVDDIYLYASEYPNGFDKDAEDNENKTYRVHTFTVNGSNATYNISYKIPVKSDTHTEHDFTSSVKVIAPDCVFNGYTIATCPGCGGQDISNVVSNKGHRWDAGLDVAATCYEAGYVVYTCQECGTKKGEQTSPALKHAHGEDATVVEPTCFSDGYSKGICVHCGVDVTIIDEGSMVGHQLGDDAVKTQVNCIQDGYISGKCRFCGIDYVDPDSVIKAYGHFCFSEGYIEKVAVTCTDMGYEKAKCACCGEVYNVKEYLATGHKLYSYVEAGKVTTKCRDCSYTKVEQLSQVGAYPSHEEMLSAIGESNLIIDAFGGENVISAGGSFENESSTLRYAKLENLNENGSTYARVTMEKSSAVPTKNPSKPAEDSNDYAYKNWGVRTDAGKKVVFEIDVRYPQILDPKEEANGGITIQGYNSDNSKTKTYGMFSVKGDGSIVSKQHPDVVLGTVGTEWTRIAVVSDIGSCVNYIYVDGVQVAVEPFVWSDKGHYDYITSIRMDWPRIEDKRSVFEFDNMYMYYADYPVYMTEAPNTNVDIKGIDIPSMDSSHMNKKEGYEDYLTVIGTASYAYKMYSKLSLFDKNADGINDAICLQVSSDIKSLGESKTDSFLTYTGFTKDGTYTFHTNITFTKVTGNVDIISGRRTSGGADGASSPQYNFLKVFYGGVDSETNEPYGIVRCVGKDLLRVYEGETLDFYVVDNEATMTVDIYINGELIVDGFNYAEASPVYAMPYGSLTYKTFNIATGTPNSATKCIDILINEIDFFSGNVVPPEYEGKDVAEKVLDDEVNTVVKFDGPQNVALLKNSRGQRVSDSRIAGGYYFTEINDSYLSLGVAPSDAIPEGNLRYVMIDKEGNEVTKDGIWTLASSDHKTNGLKNLAFYDLEGAPLNPETGNYDLTGYSAVVFRVYVKNETKNGYNILINANCGEGYIKGPVNNYETGWHEIVMSTNPEESDARNGASWDNVASLELIFSGWTTGVHTEVSCTSTSCTEDSHWNPVDGLTVYLESVSLVKAGGVLKGTGYYLDGFPCAEHTFGEETVGKELVGCDGVGYSYKTCSVCGYKEVTVLRGEGHSLELVPDECVEATCDKDGMNVYKCTNEGCTYKTKEVTDTLLHSFELKDDATEADGYKVATCIDDGYDVYVCVNENCPHTNKTFLLKIDSLGHKHDDSATVTEADCLNDRSSVGACTVCGEDVTIVYEGTKLGHNLITVTTEADCENDGSVVVKCDREGCDYVESETVLPAFGHDRPAEYLVTVVERSCVTYKGITYTCRTCGEHVEEYEVEYGKEPHKWVDWKVETPETCDEEGWQDSACEICGVKVSEVGTVEEKALCVIPAKGNHSYNETEYVYSSDDASIERTKYYACTVCGEAKPGSVIKVPAEYEGTQGLVFTDNGSGAYVITDYEGDATEIVIPATYSGKPVILGKVFADTDITSVVIPAGVKVADGAFRDCDKLVNVTLPADMTVLPAEIFYGCTSLESITLPEKCAVISNGAFFGCEKLTTITINAVLTEVQQFAFGGCAKLTTVKYVSAICPEVVISANGNDKLLEAEWIAE